MSAKDFRSELAKIMPGYTWTVHKQRYDKELEATGTQSSGFNRLSTLSVVKSDGNGQVVYTAKSAGYGLNAKFLLSHRSGTLSSALRGLQKAYESTATTHRSHAAALEQGRKPKSGAA